MTTLYTYTCDGIGLRDALQSFPVQMTEGMIGLLYSPGTCDWVYWHDDKAHTQDGPMHLDQVFEARFFNQDLEIRWLRDPAGGGTGGAACLSEQSMKGHAQDWIESTQEGLECLPGQYLLSGWGSAYQGQPEGWSLLSNASVGRRYIPRTGIGKNESAVLEYREYLGPAPGEAGSEHGNWVVRDERLLKLEKEGAR